MYSLVRAKVATRMELEEYYDLNDSLKLYSLWRMKLDIEAAQAEEAKKKSGGRRGR